MEIVAAQQNEATLAELYARVHDTVKRRWKIFSLVAGVTFVVLVAAVFMIKPTYTAQTQVRIDPTRDPVATQNGQGKTGLTDEAIDTEVSSLYSLTLAKTVVNELALDKDPEFLALASEDAQSLATPDERRTAVASELLRHLSVYREQKTYMLNIEYPDHDPVQAALISNSFADNYIKGAVGTRTSVASEQSQWYQEQLSKLSDEITQAERAASLFKAEHGLTVGTADGNSPGTIVDQQVPPLASSLAQAESEAAAARADYQAALNQAKRGGPGSVSAVLGSPVVANLRAQLAEVTRQQAQTTSQYGPLHPLSKQYHDNAADLERQISQESSRVISSLGSVAVSAHARADSLRAALGQVENVRSDQAKASVDANTLDREAETKRELYKQLNEEAQAALQSSQNSMSSATVVNQAIPPKTPSSPNRPLYLALALIVGLGAGAATITIQEALSGAIRSNEDIEEKLGLQVLSAVPFEDHLRPAQLITERPTSFYAESFRIARTTLFGSRGWPSDTPVIAFTSSLPNEGKTTSSLAFARSLADSERRTIIIDCDVRRAAMQGASDIGPNEKGLVEYLQGEASIEEILVKTPTLGLDVIMPRAPFFNAVNLFDGDRMAKLVAWAKQNYDQIVLDLPPIVGLADGRYLAALADQIIFVIKWNSTPLPAARAAIEALRSIGKNPSGVIVNAVEQNSEMLVGGNYLYRYSNYYQNAA